MRADELIEARNELAGWSQPVIVDFLHELYAARVGHDYHGLRVLCLSHGRMWRHLILGDTEKLKISRREIMGIARLAGLMSLAVEEIDQEMLSELMDIVVARFFRTPSRARLNGQILLGIATTLATFAVVAA